MLPFQGPKIGESENLKSETYSNIYDEFFFTKKATP